MLSGLLSQWGAEGLDISYSKGCLRPLLAMAKKALAGSDLLVIIAGSSAGTRDLTADVIAEMGEVLVHGVSIMPGKPVILGKADQKPVIGLPGYPVSAVIAFELFRPPGYKPYAQPAYPSSDSLKGQNRKKTPLKAGPGGIYKGKVRADG